MKKVNIFDLDFRNEIIAENPELAKKYYPQVIQSLKQLIKNSHPFLTDLLIRKIPYFYPQWKTKAEQYFGKTREKIIKSYIELIEIILNQEFPTESEQNAVESVRAELTEQLEYWEQQLKQNNFINKRNNSELSISQIALKFVYLGKQITRENCKTIAQEYGYKSGEKLYQRFTYFSSPANRRGAESTPKKHQNKIDLIESVIKFLPEDKKQQAIEDVSKLKEIKE